jgi:hypothetical protein
LADFLESSPLKPLGQLNHEMSNLYRRPSKDAPYQVSIHLAKRFREEDFLEINQSEQEWPCRLSSIVR